MYLLLAGVLLVFVGLAFILMKKDAKPVLKGSSDQTSGTKTGSQTDLDKANEKSVPLESLVAPSNFPEVVFYFGSQTGTAEKFATVLDEEANKL